MLSTIKPLDLISKVTSASLHYEQHPSQPADDPAGEQRLAQALAETASVINQSLDLDEVLQLILQTIGNVVPHDAANIMLIDDGMAKITATHGYEKVGVGKSVLMTHRRDVTSVPNLRRMVETGECIVIPDTSQSPDWVHLSTSGWIRSYLSAPIRRQQKTIGFINLNSSTQGLYSQRHAERLRSFADQSAIAIENARLYRKAQEELAVRKQVELELQKTLSGLESRVEQRTAELKNMNAQLQQELIRRRKAEQALESERVSLAKRVEERTAELSAANAELAKAARLKDAFLANMSHELRTPLNAILNIAETLEEQVYGPLVDRQLRALHTQQESATHLLSLINDILDLSKIGAGRFDLVMDLIPVRALCNASLQMVEEVARKKDINLSMIIDPAVKTIWGDLRRMKQVLVNLLSNAVKFTPTGGAVGLAVAGDLENGQAHFMVWDTGIGIASTDIPNLFKPFSQLDNSLARKYEGTGLGLALAYRIVELHGGGIQVSSEEGKGSQFTVTLSWGGENGDLPRPAGQTAPALCELDPGSSLGEKTLRFLSDFGIEFTRFTLGEDTFQKIVAVSPNIVVLNLPLDADTRALIQALRADPRTAPVRILISNQATGSLAAGDLPEGVIPLSLISSRQDFRALLRSASAGGTASLIRKAVLVNQRPAFDPRKETRILLVDDNEATVRPVLDYLASRGYRVILAYSGPEAIGLARESSPDLILMDIQMPGMDGVEAIRRIRADASLQKTPIIALTALAMPSDRQRCLEAGANGYLSKPVSLRHLTDFIGAHIGIS